MSNQPTVGYDFEYELSVAEIKIRHLEQAADTARETVSRLESQAKSLRATVAQLREEAEKAERDQEHLEAGLVTSRQIAAAVGILMATRKLTYDDAFAALSAESQARNRKLRDLAADLVFTGAF